MESNKVDIETRTRLPKSHVNMLETLYKEMPRPSLRIRKELALRMGVEQRKVQVWFQNRRAKDVRENDNNDNNNNNNNNNNGFNNLNTESNRLSDFLSGNQDSISSLNSSVRSSPTSPNTTLKLQVKGKSVSSSKSQKAEPTPTFSHYWASTMNTCKMLKF